MFNKFNKELTDCWHGLLFNSSKDGLQGAKLNANKAIL